MSVDFGIWGALSDGFVLCCLPVKVFQVAPSCSLAASLCLPPFPFRPLAPSAPLFAPSLVFSSGLGVAELWDKEVQTCLTFLDPLVESSWQLLQNAFAVFLFAQSVGACRSLRPILFPLWNGDSSLFSENLLMWEIISRRNERTRQKSGLAAVWDVFCWAVWAEGLGTALYIWQIDFCQQLSSDRLPAFEEEDQICGSMLCAGWTPKRT